jgi:hypothetical protein
VHKIAAWLPHTILCAFVVGIATLASLSREAETPFVMEITLAATVDGVLQVFYDRGRGISEAESAAAPIHRSSEPVTYHLPLRAGRHRLFRIDPNNRGGGDYSFTGIRILSSRDVQVATIPLDELKPAAPATLTTKGGAALVQVPPAANDPQLLYVPGRELVLIPDDGRNERAALAGGVGAIAAVLLLLFVTRMPRFSVTLPSSWQLRRRPPLTIVAAGIVATIVATYPLFLGRSLVSPNNGGAAFVYDEAPFAYDSQDYVLEDTRGADIGSMMWAILPYSALQREAIGRGEFPLWNRYNAIGRPLWGQGQHFFLEPVHLLTLAIGEPSYRADVAFIASRAIFSVGVGMAALAATSSLPAALIVTISAPFIGYFAFRFNHPAYFSIEYVPWILWAYFRLASRSTRTGLASAATVLITASVFQLFGSTPKEGVAAFTVAQITGMLAVLFAPGSVHERLRRLAACVAAMAVTVLISAPHWLIFLDTLRRAFTISDAPFASFLHWQQLPAIALGTLLPGTPYPSLNGLVAVAAATGVLTSAFSWHNRAALASAVGATIALAIACGVIPAAVFVSLPFLGNLHHVWNVFITAALTPLLVVAASGLAALRAAPVRSLAAMTVATAALLIVIRIGMPGLPASRVVLSIAPGVALALLQALARPTSRSVFTAATVVVLATGLFPGGLHVETGVPRLDAVLLQPRKRVDLDTDPPAVTAVRSRAGNEPFRVVSLFNAFFQGVQTLYRLEGITGPDALQLREINELSDAAGIYRSQWVWYTAYNAETVVRANGFLDMLGVRFVFGRTYAFPSDAARLPLPQPDPLQVIERPTAWPRAFFVDGIRRHTSLSELVAELNSSSKPFASIDAADPHAAAAIAGLPALESRVAPARDYVLTPNRTSFVIDAPGPGVVVLTEAYVPRDFIATHNGKRSDYFRVNHALKAVTVPAAGTWTITFEYRPEHWRLGWMLCGAGLTIAVVALFIARSSLSAGNDT